MMIMIIITYYHLLSLIVTCYYQHYDYDYHSGCHYDSIHDSAEKKTQIIGAVSPLDSLDFFVISFMKPSGWVKNHYPLKIK